MSLLFLLGILHLVVVSGSNDEVGEDQGYLLYCPCMGRWAELKITLLSDISMAIFTQINMRFIQIDLVFAGLATRPTSSLA